MLNLIRRISRPCWIRRPVHCLTVVFAIAATSFVSEANGDDGNSSKPIALRDLNGHFPVKVADSLAQWQTRAEALRLQTKVAMASHPLPIFASTKPVIHGRREMDGYSIEKIYFESLPGLFVTGSLFRPLEKTDQATRRPVVLYAHGHWENGRFHEASPREIKQQIAMGAERFESAATNMLQAACVQLARMGCIVFQYDMLGYADSQQISFQRAHRYGLMGPNEPTTQTGWPLYSATAESYNQSVMAIQTLNTIRAIDVIGSLDDVDASRMVITGASGGGTQSFIAAAIEPRLTGAFPAVMVSTGMQGGCTCENACGLRVGTGNVEIAATIAPRPLGLTAANDWTKTMPEDGFPELKQFYGLFGKPNQVELNAFIHFPHNYNHVSRTAMYGWVNRTFGLRLEEPVLERDFTLLGRDELTVWDDEHPSPPSGIDFERELLAKWAGDIRAFIKPSTSGEETQNKKVVQVLREGWTTILNPALAIVSSLRVTSEKTPAASIHAALSTGETVGRLSMTMAGIDNDENAQRNEKSLVVLALGQPTKPLPGGRKTWRLQTLDDVFKSTSDGQILVDQPRPAASYTYGYNAPQMVRRLGVLVALFDEAVKTTDAKITVSTDAEHAFFATGLAMLRPGKIAAVSIDGTAQNLDGFFSVANSITDPDFVPHSLRYGDLPGLLRVAEESGTQVKFAE